MSKYPCGLIEDLLPLYIEGDVSDETKEIVEKHLKDCKECTALVQQYSNDEIKPEIFQEDLPQASTFKKLMKKLKVWGLVTAAVALTIFISIGTIGYQIGEGPNKDLLTLNAVVKTFEKQGIGLKEDSSRALDEYELKGVKPVSYSIDGKQDTMLIYIFNSFVERENIVRDSHKFDNRFDILERPYNAKNALIVVIAGKTPETEEDLINLGKTNSMVSDIVFKQFNDGKEIVYKGQSESWEGTFTLKYYEHWWKDQAGIQHYESYHMASPEIKYRKTDIETVGPIDFQFKTTGMGGGSTGAELSKDGSAHLGSSGGNGAMPHKEDDINFTIKWNGKEESFVLKAK